MSPATTTTNVTTATRRPLPDGLGSKLAYLTRVLKTPTIGRVWEDRAAAARDANWSHEEYLAAVLERQVADRESAGNMMRVRTAHFPPPTADSGDPAPRRSWNQTWCELWLTH